MINEIGNAFNKIEKTNPSIGFGITQSGEDEFAIYLNSYESFLNNEERKKKAFAEAFANLDGLLKKLKEIFKKDTGKALKVKIIAEGGDVEMLSLNNRHKLTVKRMFKVEE